VTLDVPLSTIEALAVKRQNGSRAKRLQNHKRSTQSDMRIEIDGLIGEFAVAQYFSERRGEAIPLRLKDEPDGGWDLVIDGHTVDVKFSRYPGGDLCFKSKGDFKARRAILAVPMFADYLTTEHPAIRMAGWIRREEFMQECLLHPLPFIPGKAWRTWQGAGMTQPTVAVKNCHVCAYHYSPIREVVT